MFLLKKEKRKNANFFISNAKKRGKKKLKEGRIMRSYESHHAEGNSDSNFYRWSMNYFTKN